MILCLNEEVVSYGDNVVLKYVDVDGNKTVYISRELYDICVILVDRYGDCDGVAAKIVGTGHEEDIRCFIESAPHPLHILGPFLNLIPADVQIERQFDKMCSYLSMMSCSIDFLNYMKVPVEVKKSVSFTQYDIKRCDSMQKQFTERVKIAEVDETSVTKEFIKSIVAEAVESVMHNLPIMQPVVPTVVEALSMPSPKYVFKEEVSQEDVVEETVKEEDDIWAELNSMFNDEEESSEEVEEPEDKRQTVAEELQIAEQEADSEKSFIDNIAKLYGGV